MAELHERKAGSPFKFGTNKHFSFDVTPDSSPRVEDDHKKQNWVSPGRLTPQITSPADFTGSHDAKNQGFRFALDADARHDPSSTFDPASHSNHANRFSYANLSILFPPATPPPPGLTRSPENLDALLKLAPPDWTPQGEGSHDATAPRYVPRRYLKKVTKFVPQKEPEGALKLPPDSPRPTPKSKVAFNGHEQSNSNTSTFEIKKQDTIFQEAAKVRPGALRVNTSFPQHSNYSTSPEDLNHSPYSFPSSALHHGAKDPVDGSATTVSPSPVKKDKRVAFELPSSHLEDHTATQKQTKAGKRQGMGRQMRDFDVPKPIGDQLRELGYAPPPHLGEVGPAGWQPFPNHEDAARHAAEFSPLKKQHHNSVSRFFNHKSTPSASSLPGQSLSSRYPPKEERIPPCVRFNGHATDLEAERSQPVNLESQMEEMEILLQESLRLKGIQGDACERLCRLAAEAYAEVFPYEMSATMLEL